MTRRVLYILGLLAAAGALIASEIRQVDADVSPTAVMYFVADTQRELTRLPVRFTRLSDGEEIRLGDKLAERARAHLVPERLAPDDKEMSDYVSAVGARLSTQANRKLPYKFYFVPDRSFVNAFALPGGSVFFGAGLLEQMDSEDQLAAILGHEIEHIDHYHAIERLQLEAALRKIPLGALLSIPVEIFQAGYSKEQELEADREGMKMAARVGYSPEGAVRVFDAFARLRERVHRRARTPGQELSSTAQQLLVEYFRSHPEPEDRQAHLRSTIASEKWLQGRAERDLTVMPLILARRAADAVEATQYERAAVLARRAVAARPQHVGALTALAKAAFALRRFDEAVDAYRRAIAQESAAGVTIRAAAQRAAGDLIAQQKPAEAVQILQQLLKLQPAEPHLTGMLAHAQALTGDFAGSAASAAQMVKLYPAEAETLAQRMQQAARDYMSRHDFGNAVAAAWVAVHTDPASTGSRILLADARFAQARFREAADELAKLLLARKIADADLLRAYAESLAAIDGARAAALFDSTLQRMKFSNDNASAHARCESAGLRLLAGDPAPATELAEQAELGNVPPELLVRLARWQLRAGDAAAAADRLEHVLRLRPGDVVAINLLAWTELELDRLDPAAKRFENLCDSCSAETIGVPPLWNTPELGRVIALWRLGKQEDALKLYPAAVARAPQWKTEVWRTALQPPKSAQAFAQIAGEYERRRTEALERMRQMARRRK